jgi:large conductance mechanosensitive channel
MGLAKEFREFILKGSVVDLAVGVIIGAAFGAIVKSAVDDLMMPPLGYVMGGVDFGEKKFTLAEKGTIHPITQQEIKEQVDVRYGKFLNALIQLTIQGLAIFLVIKLINKLRKPAVAVPPGPPPLTKEQELLTEIRDLLRKG